MCFSSAEGAADRSAKVAKKMAKVFFVKVWRVKIWFVVVEGTSAKPYPVRRRLRQSFCWLSSCHTTSNVAVTTGGCRAALGLDGRGRPSLRERGTATLNPLLSRSRYSSA